MSTETKKLAKEIIVMFSEEYYSRIDKLAKEENITTDEFEEMLNNYFDSDPDFLMYKQKKYYCMVHNERLYAYIGDENYVCIDDENNEDYKKIIKILSRFYLEDDYTKYFTPIETWQGISDELINAVEENKPVIYYRGGEGYIYGTWLYNEK
jgi:hypothetical protein